MEHEQGLLFAQCLRKPLFQLLRLRERDASIVKALPIRAGGDGQDKRGVVAEEPAVVEVIIIVPLFAPLERVVKRRVEVVILPADAHDIPCVAVFDPARGVRLAERDDAPQAELVAQRLDGLRDALAHADALRHGAENFMRIRLFELVVAHVFQNEIVHGKLFFRLRLPFERLRQPGQTCTDRLLVRANFCFVKQILRQKLHMRRAGHPPAAVAGDVKEQRLVELQPQIHVRKLLFIQHRNADAGRKRAKAAQKRVIHALQRPGKLSVIISHRTSKLQLRGLQIIQSGQRPHRDCTARDQSLRALGAVVAYKHRAPAAP